MYASKLCLILSLRYTYMVNKPAPPIAPEKTNQRNGGGRGGKMIEEGGEADILSLLG